MSVVVNVNQGTMNLIVLRMRMRMRMCVHILKTINDYLKYNLLLQSEINIKKMKN